MPSGADSVVLPGPAMLPLVRAVAALGESGLARYAIVGGVAVAVRLGHAHRATADVDTVVYETVPPDALETLATLPGARRDSTAQHRVFIEETKVEVLGVAPLEDQELEGIPANDALFAGAHAWALETATPVRVVAGDDPEVEAIAPFATPAALFAMKLHAIQDRRATAGQDKRAGDAWDLYRILVDLDTEGAVRASLQAAPPVLRARIRDAADRVLVTNAARTRAWLRAGDDRMAAVTVEELRLVAQPVVDALS